MSSLMGSEKLAAVKGVQGRAKNAQGVPIRWEQSKVEAEQGNW